MLSLWIIQALRIAFSQQKISLKSGLNFIASACLIIGAVGFFGSGLSASGGLNFLPKTFEWPIGEADGAIINPDGTIIVPHEPSGRIQIYNKSLEYQRGWSIETGGGSFKLQPAENGNFFIYTARGDYKYLYDIHGSLLKAEKYQGDYPKDSSASCRVSIPTPFYLKVFTHPFASWFVAAIGMGLLYITGFGRSRKT